MAVRRSRGSPGPRHGGGPGTEHSGHPDRVPGAPRAGEQDAGGMDCVVAFDPSETVVNDLNFRTFTGKYVIHGHDLAHEDHAMLTGFAFE